MTRILPYRSIRDLDWWLLSISLAICALGVLQIFSATHGTKWADAWWKQIIFVAIGVVVVWVVSAVDYHALLSRAYVLYALSLLLLVGVFVVGTTVFGSTRWIIVGGVKFQISEFVKIVLVLAVARYLSGIKLSGVEGKDLLRLGVLIAVPMGLVMKQPDLGTGLTYLPVLAVGLFIAGLRWQYYVVAGLALAILLPVAWAFVLQDFQKDRIRSFLDPSLDPKGAGYQVIQSKIAVGSGEIWGKGVTKGTQTQLRFLPVPHTDFIFSAFSEEHGFVGVVVVLSLYFLLIMQIVQNAQTAPDRAGMYICMGIASLLLFHVLVNVGMAVGRMPVTGIPLPLMSSGGSNILSIFIMLGLVNNVRLRRFVN